MVIKIDTMSLAVAVVAAILAVAVAVKILAS